MEFPKDIEQLEDVFSKYCEMFYKLNSSSEYKDDVKIKISFINTYESCLVKSIFECDIDFKSIGDLDKSIDVYSTHVGDHLFDSIYVLIEYCYKNERTGIQIPLWINGILDQGFIVDFNSFESINKIFIYISNTVLTYEYMAPKVYRQ